MGFSLKKHEILRSKKSIKELFASGSSFFLYPFKIFYLPNIGEKSSQVLFTVPKKYFKKAVDRNLIRRRMREAYRLNKNVLNIGESGALSHSIGLIYIAKSALPYSEIDRKLKQVLVRLNKNQE